MYFNESNKEESFEIFKKALEIGVGTKLNNNFKQKDMEGYDVKKLYQLPKEGTKVDDLLGYFQKEIIPYCSNFSNVNFMGFPDAGNSVAGISGAILADFLQQNLINNSFCAPIATYLEIAVISWLREVVGFKVKEINNIWDVGGIITYGGTGSNATAMLLARENHKKHTMQNGVSNPSNYKTIIPQGIGHYSIRSSSQWIGCGDNIIEVPTVDFKYDLQELEKAIRENKDDIMCVVCYVGDSRTMTIENLEEVCKLVKSINPNIWVHADACHGFSLGFSNKHKHKIKGIEMCDSVSTDPHKVLDLPYCLSALLVKEPQTFKTITSTSDLIMQEDFAIGQITPFIGSKSWVSLKLWFVMKNLGMEGIEKMIDDRLENAQKLKQKLISDKDFVVLNDVDINSVVFMFVKEEKSIENLNKLNKKIHSEMLKEGLYHVHQFSIPDNKGILKKDEIVYPLRYMSGNPNIQEKDLDGMIEYVKKLGEKILNEQTL